MKDSINGRQKMFRKRVGRSIEEVLVQRQLDAFDPTSWPDTAATGGGKSSSQRSLPRLRLDLESPLNTRDGREGPGSAFAATAVHMPQRAVSFNSSSGGYIKPPATAIQAAYTEQTSEATLIAVMEHCRNLQDKLKGAELKLMQSQQEKEELMAYLQELTATEEQHNVYFSEQNAEEVDWEQLQDRMSTLPMTPSGRRSRGASARQTRPSQEAAGKAESRGGTTRRQDQQRSPQGYNQNNNDSFNNNNNNNNNKNTSSSRRKLMAATVAAANQLNAQQSSPTNSGNYVTNADAGAGGGGGGAIVSESMNRIDLKVLHLNELFKPGNPFEERRVAATKIESVVRGFLARVHYAHFRRGLKEWKWSRCRQVIYLLDILLANQAKLSFGFQQMKMNQDCRLLHAVFSKWNAVARQNAPMRHNVRRASEELIAARRLARLRQVFDALKLVSIGVHSRKHASLQRRQLIESIRHELSAKWIARGSLGVVTEDEIVAVFHRRILAQFLKDKAMLLQKRMFGAFVTLLKLSRRSEAVAKEWWFKGRVGRCFYAWSDWTYQVCAGLNRRRWNGPRKYEIRYNQKRVDGFAVRRCLLYVFRPWVRQHRTLMAVNACFQKQTSRFLQKNFLALKEAVKEQRRLRVMTLDNWRGYPRLMVERPFRAWAALVRAVKNHFNEQVRIVNSYNRWRMRQKMILIMRTWRHQAIFGRVDGMYTRQMLLKSLAEQKQMTTMLEKLLASQTVELEECHALVSKEISKTRELEQRLTLTGLDLNRQKMLCHHAEQEITRLGAIIEAMAQINPRQVQHLKKLQPTFKFKERQIQFPQEDQAMIAAAAASAESLLLSQNALPANYKATPSIPAGAKAGSSVASGMGLSLVAGNDDNDNNSNNNAEQSSVVSAREDGTDGMEEAELAESDVGASESGKETTSAEGEGAAATEPPTGIPTNVPVPGTLEGERLVSLHDETAADSLHGPSMASTNPSQPVPEPEQPAVVVANLSTEDQLILDRAKWLIKKFAREPMPDFVEFNEGMLAEDGAAGVPGEGDELSLQQSQSSGDRSQSVRALTDVDSEASDQSSVHPQKVRPSILPSADIDAEKWKFAWDQKHRVAQNAAGKVSLAPDGMVAEGAAEVGFDPLEGMAAKMLIAVMDFLSSGDVTAFAPDDRREWIQTVLGDAAKEADESSAAPADAANAVVDVEGAMAKEEEDGAPFSRMDSTQSAQSLGTDVDPVECAKKYVEESVEDLTAMTWRQSIMSLRTMHAGAGSYTGIENWNEAQTQNGLFARLLEMRKMMKEVVRRQLVKYNLHNVQIAQTQRNLEILNALNSAKPSGGGGGSGRSSLLAGGGEWHLPGGKQAGLAEEEEDENAAYEPINIYAGNLGNFLKEKTKDPVKEEKEDEDDDHDPYQ